MKKSIHYCIKNNGKSHFLDWINSLDTKQQVIVDRYIQRVSQKGARKSVKHLKEGIFEIKIAYSSGLRVYFGETEDRAMLLLVGGDKKTQKRDILKAQEYWRDYGQKT